MVAVRFDLQCSLPHTPPDPANSVTNHGWLCIFYQVALGQSQAVAKLDLHKNSSKEAPEPTHLEASFRLQQNTTLFVPKVAHLKDGLNRHRSPMGKILFCGISTHTEAHMLWAWLVLTAIQPENQSYPLMF